MNFRKSLFFLIVWGAFLFPVMTFAYGVTFLSQLIKTTQIDSSLTGYSFALASTTVSFVPSTLSASLRIPSDGTRLIKASFQCYTSASYSVPCPSQSSALDSDSLLVPASVPNVQTEYLFSFASR